MADPDDVHPNSNDEVGVKILDHLPRQGPVAGQSLEPLHHSCRHIFQIYCSDFVKPTSVLAAGYWKVQNSDKITSVTAGNHRRIPLVRTSSELTVRRPGKAPKSRSQSVPRPARDDPLSPRVQLEQSTDSRRVQDWDPRAQSSEPILFPKISPMGMIFIPCYKGYSHKPEEFSSNEDIANEVKVLALTLAKLSLY
ncbi:hypothetical protein Vadar_018807 [Vaccinium darrowii]|uniref:Uncharacterized protein n=1 Tax=Vaccinium darrowii TaxID=229202 RepID=A0ACB7YXI2_9ERIC|nr:hypothetical protein Vadar_018807 [Vaccinium darrowii]